MTSVRTRYLQDLTREELADLRRRFPSFDPDEIYRWQRRNGINTQWRSRRSVA